MENYEVRIGTRTGVRSDDLMFTRTFWVEALSVRSAKSFAMIFAKLQDEIIKTGWRDWTETSVADQSMHPESDRWIASRDTLCDAQGKQSFVHLFWEGSGNES